LRQAVRAFKLRLINRVLEETHGNQTLAAKHMGIARTYLTKILRDIRKGEYYGR
jgi:DNA-binding protein Fis